MRPSSTPGTLTKGILTRGILTKGILTGILTGALAISYMPTLDTATADVIVRGADLEAVAAAVTAHGGTVDLEIGLIDAVAATVPAAALDALAADARTTQITPDAPVEVMANDLDPQHRGRTAQEAAYLTGGEPAQSGLGYDGTGIDVAVVDTGVNAALLHDTKIVPGIDLSFGDDSGLRDGYGHGTAMAGVVAGHGRRFQGVAPDARIVDVKVADDRGVADVSQVLAGIDWVVSNRDTDGRNIRVLSLSFGTDGSNDAATSPLAYAVEAAWRHGIVVVASAGNHGTELGRLASPAIDPWIIAVGAADLGTIASYEGLDATTVPSWSAWGDGVRNPDLVAPGRSMLGGRAPLSAIETANPDAIEDDYFLGSGSSQAAAYTAGVVAMMLEADPTLTPDEVKALLVATARPLDADVRQAGAGLLDLGRLFPGTGALSSLPVDATQAHAWSDGSGSLDGDRGRFVLEDADGNLLTGENTVVGAFDRDAWRSSTWTGSTWTGSTWTGSTWTGSTWTGSTWTSSTWTGSTWTNVIWGE